MNNNIFERNPAKTMLAVLLLMVGGMDIFARTRLDVTVMPKPKGAFKIVLVPRVALIGIPHPYYHHDMRSNTTVRATWGGVTYPLVTNSFGFKDEVERRVGLSVSAGKKRIVFIGDSFTEGVGFPYEKTFSGVLSKRLQNKNIELLNAAVQSYSPMLYYLKMQYLVEKKGLKFNQLYVFIDLSDIEDEVLYGMDFQPQKDWPVLWKIDSFLNRHSLIYAYFFKWREEAYPKVSPSRAVWKSDEMYCKERPNWAEDRDVLKRWGNRGLLTAYGHMSLLSDLCKRNGIKLTIAVYPWPQQIMKKELRAEPVVFWKHFAREKGVDFIDLFPHFIGKAPSAKVVRKYFIKDDVHWSEEGHKFVADVMFKKITALRAD